MFRSLVSAVAGYLVGSFPSADVASRLAGSGSDLRAEGSGNPGAVNAGQVLGKAWGWGVLAADTAKGASACGLGRSIAGSTGAHVAGTAAVIGHCFPVWNGFRGGKGVAVSLGQCAATFPAYLPIDLGIATVAGKVSGRAITGTAVASTAWVAAATIWWRRRWPNAWGPAPSVWLPVAAAVSSAVILQRFAAAALRAEVTGSAAASGAVRPSEPAVADVSTAGTHVGTVAGTVVDIVTGTEVEPGQA